MGKEQIKMCYTWHVPLQAYYLCKVTLTALAAEGCSFFQSWSSTSRSSKGFPKRCSHPLPKGLCLQCKSYCSTACLHPPGWRSHSELTGGNSGQVWHEEPTTKIQQGWGQGDLETPRRAPRLATSRAGPMLLQLCMQALCNVLCPLLPS